MENSTFLSENYKVEGKLNKKTLKLKILIPGLILLLFLSVIGYKFCFLRIRISDAYYILQKPFTNNFILKSKTKGKILEHIYEWKETDNYIYGSCLTKDTYFLYEKMNNELNIFDDLHSFYICLDKYDLIYTMDNCSRIMDYRKVY